MAGMACTFGLGLMEGGQSARPAAAAPCTLNAGLTRGARKTVKPTLASPARPTTGAGEAIFADARDGAHARFEF